MAALLTTLTSVLSSLRTPTAKAAAVGVLLVVALCVPNLHENVLIDYYFQSDRMVMGAVVECLREAALHRTVAADCVALLVLLCNVQRYDSRNPFHARARALAADAVSGPRTRDPYVPLPLCVCAVRAMRASVLVRHCGTAALRFVFPSPPLPPPPAFPWRLLMVEVDRLCVSVARGPIRFRVGGGAWEERGDFVREEGSPGTVLRAPRACTRARTRARAPPRACRSFDTGDDDGSSPSARSSATVAGEPPAALKALQTVAAHCQSGLCAVAQRPIMGTLDGRIAGEEAARVTTAATLASGADAGGAWVHGTDAAAWAAGRFGAFDGATWECL
jgi:hypothetical protein